ncbi:hypothetical protein OJF2_67960 [Aquisphaera giovannonii]|uniref:Uncharacterized protein n=1 Tax=Aquisphaera giovannonii TaxID=406548 RepID=A0A5B9WC02_9BACT|nr:hypothetical protein [Aquisphaera giovannonii]QEH38198.1 hypothetical protein OJF2_67960 [Aquisphaera giovannonii]
MSTTIMTITLALAVGGAGQCPGAGRCPHGHAAHRHGSGGWILPDGPGDGWGYPNGNPDGYGWFDPAPYLPLGGNRTDAYYFPRYFAYPPQQMFMGIYYNPYVTAGQRYIPYSGGGGCHPAGGLPPDSASVAVRPYSSLNNERPVTTVPRLRGRVEATPETASGKTGLTP